jgi:hypothetical protein
VSKFFKYFFLITCVSIYVFSTIGISVFTHYCGDEIESISYLTKAKSCCGDEDEAMDCCKDEVTHFSLKSDFTFYTLVKKQQIVFLQLFYSPVSEIYHTNNVTIAQFCDKDKPRPPNLIQSKMINVSNLRI